MNIKTISLENFKAFSNKQELSLAPITLIYGANSSGKSSIIHSLMVLKQSLLKPNLKGGLTSNKRFLDLGTYPTMVFKHNINSDITFSIRDNKNNYVAIKYSYESKEDFSYIKNIELNSNKLEIQIKNSFKDNYTNYFEISNEFKNKFINQKKNSKQQNLFTYWNFTPSEEIPIPQNISLDFSKLIDDEILKKDIEFSELHDFYAINNHHYQIGIQSFLKTIKNLSYLGPLRANPQRYYSIESDYEISVGKEGENLAYFFQNNKLKLQSKINQWFERLDIPYTFEVKNLGNKFSENLLNIILKDKRINVEVSPMDVGFGIGQILPILVEGLVKKESTICVEQPEIHLHPKLQAELADYFIETRKQNQWVIETHSESLMLRIQKRMREGKITPSDISILYVLPDEVGSNILKIDLDENGNFIDEWPNGFFEERLNERFF